jgi:putative ABC transport system permease protein
MDQLRERLQQDVRLALRGIKRTPAFFATAVVILALGIGLSVAMFTVFRTVLVRKLPVTNQDRVVVMWTYRADPATDYSTGTKDLAVVRKETRTMQDVAAVAHWPATSTPFKYGDRPISLMRGMITGNFFDVLGVRPALGRLMTTSDDQPNGYVPGSTPRTDALVLSYRAWREKFGGDSAVIGKQLVEPLLGQKFQIIGVAPPGFDYPAHADYWIPMWGGWRSDVSAFAVVRLKPAASVAAARDEYLAIANRVEPLLKARGAYAATFAEIVLGNVTPVLIVLTAAVALLLAIACINVGNLMLLRASSRTQEIAVRRALGAEYGDIVRQLFVESSVVAVAGGILGLAIAISLVRLLVAFAPGNLPRVDDIQLSGAPISVAIAVSTLAVLVFGLAPALLSARSNIASPLRFDSRSGHETRHRRVLRQALVVSQVVLAVVMLSGAGLLARSLARLENQDAGYVSDHLSVLGYSWDAHKYATAPTLIPLGDRLAARIKQVPGVTSVTQIVVSPMLGNGVWQVRVQREDQTEAESVSNPTFATELIGPGFFDTFGIRVLRGRAFTADDREHAPLVAIVSEGVAKRMWPGENAIGKRIRLPWATPESFGGGNGWRTVVGVARDANLRTIREPSPMMFFPSVQGYWQGSIAIRSSVDLNALVPALRAAGHDADPSLELANHNTMDQILSEPLAQPRLGALLMSAFGGVALLLAAIGLYGLMASVIRDQTREIGIRMALGASPSRVSRDIFGRAAALVGVGTVIGVLAALLTSRLFAGLLFQVKPSDPVSLAGACLVLLAAGALASLLPVLRATRIDPVKALRAE